MVSQQIHAVAWKGLGRLLVSMAAMLFAAFSVCAESRVATSCIGGTIVDERGNPVRNARIIFAPKDNIPDFLELNSDLHVELSDTVGHWSCVHSSNRLAEIQFVVTHPDFARSVYTTEKERADTDRMFVRAAEILTTNAVFILHNGTMLSGTVTKEDGRPIEGARILGSDYPTWTLFDGRFTIKNARPKMRLVVLAPGCGPAVVQVLSSNTNDALRVQLKAAKPLRVTVTDSGGKPVPGVAVTVEKWHGQIIPLWKWNTDFDGHLIWDAPPAAKLKFSFAKTNFVPITTEFSPDGNEHVVMLRKIPRVVGSVTDQKTGAVVREFHVIPGRLHVDHYDWDRSRLATFNGGHFEMLLREESVSNAFLVEADGYFPQSSRTFGTNEEELLLDFALRVGAPLRGVVKMLGGEPAAGVQVGLISDADGILLGAGKFVHHEQSNVRTTGADGSFVFQPSLAPRCVVALSQDGCAIAPIVSSESPLVLTLRPWGAIEGTMQIGGTRLTNEITMISAVDHVDIDYHENAFSVLTDRDGRFRFKFVPPGEYLVSRVVNGNRDHAVAVVVGAGKTSTVNIGGSGKSVVGKVVSSNAALRVDWSDTLFACCLRSKLPELTTPEFKNEAEKRAWELALWRSPEGKERLRHHRHYLLDLKADGHFRVDDVPPGEYDLEIHYHEASAEVNMPDVCLGKSQQSVTIPVSTSGDSIDVGSVVVALKRQPK